LPEPKILAGEALARLPTLSGIRAEVHEELDVAESIEAQVVEEANGGFVAGYGAHFDEGHSGGAGGGDHPLGKLAADTLIAEGGANRYRLELGLAALQDEPGHADHVSVHLGYPDKLAADAP
jgi:hypothetical protein